MGNSEYVKNYGRPSISEENVKQIKGNLELIKWISTICEARW